MLAAKFDDVRIDEPLGSAHKVVVASARPRLTKCLSFAALLSLAIYGMRLAPDAALGVFALAMTGIG
jgi:hypothetical protein